MLRVASATKKRTVGLRVVGETPRRRKNKDVRAREYLTPSEVEALAAAAKKRGRYGYRDAFIIRFAARHGFRITELCSLEWGHIDLDGSRMFVTRLKNGLQSTHPLLGWEMRALRQLRRENPDGRYVLMSERGAPFTRAALAKMVERTGKSAGFTFPVHFHMLRHATGYALVNQGKDTRSLQEWLGHVNIQHTIGYTRLSDQRFKGW
jgi:integrase